MATHCGCIKPRNSRPHQQSPSGSHPVHTRTLQFSEGPANMKCILLASAVMLLTVVSAYPKIRVRRQENEDSLLLPSNATSIRSSITDTFSCDSRKYGYYADVDNGCQIFHVCLPALFPDGHEQMFKWSFICPEETIFNQESFTCTREEDAIACEESPQYYNLNDFFGRTDPPPSDTNQL